MVWSKSPRITKNPLNYANWTSLYSHPTAAAHSQKASANKRAPYTQLDATPPHQYYDEGDGVKWCGQQSRAVAKQLAQQLSKMPRPRNGLDHNKKTQEADKRKYYLPYKVRTFLLFAGTWTHNSQVPPGLRQDYKSLCPTPPNGLRRPYVRKYHRA